MILVPSAQEFPFFRFYRVVEADLITCVACKQTPRLTLEGIGRSPRIDRTACERVQNWRPMSPTSGPTSCPPHKQRDIWCHVLYRRSRSCFNAPGLYVVAKNPGVEGNVSSVLPVTKYFVEKGCGGGVDNRQLVCKVHNLRLNWKLPLPVARKVGAEVRFAENIRANIFFVVENSIGNCCLWRLPYNCSVCFMA